ncbi:MAG: hypothetical protein GPJ54_01930 [Candidatus Heimdallarchaeota archaeon]|nr:hypothetical protein [Candidatus Heimdallarchaeota archaeon]
MAKYNLKNCPDIFICEKCDHHIDRKTMVKRVLQNKVELKPIFEDRTYSSIIHCENCNSGYWRFFVDSRPEVTIIDMTNHITVDDLHSKEKMAHQWTEHIERARNDISQIGSEFAKKYYLSWYGPSELFLMQSGIAHENYDDLIGRLSELPLLLLRNKEKKAEYMICLAYQDEVVNPYQSRVLSPNLLEYEEKMDFAKFAQGMWFLIEMGKLPHPLYFQTELEENLKLMIDGELF